MEWDKDGEGSPTSRQLDEEVQSYLSGEEEQQSESFPGLNKAHGFFSMIEKNQRSRDTYHQKMEEWKQVGELATP